MRGVVARIVVDGDGRRKGFGFIGAEGQDYFFHASGMEATGRRFEEVQEGDAVEFTPIDGPSGKGPRAIEVRVVAA